MENSACSVTLLSGTATGTAEKLYRSRNDECSPFGWYSFGKFSLNLG